MCTGRGTASIHNKISAVSVVAKVWSQAFKANFLPFWAHSAVHDLRAARLDAVQYSAIHAMNGANKLLLLFSDEERMKVQRLVLQTPSANLMTLEEVALTLGIQKVKGMSCNGGTKSIVDSVKCLGGAGGRSAALVMQFCKMASICSHFKVYDLGTKTRHLQEKALLKRTLVNEFYDNGELSTSQLMSKVPSHAKELCACVACHRVTNSIADDAGLKWNVSFNELGTSGSMMYKDTSTGENELRCAKRSSTSFKTGVAFEENMMHSEVEQKECNYSEVQCMICNPSVGAGGGVMARARRDAKSAYEQRKCSVACGQDSMLRIPLLGNVVQLWNEWYALCSFCGCCVRVTPSNRYDTEICCMRCDFDLLNRHNKLHTQDTFKNRSTCQICRFCGKVCFTPYSHMYHPHPTSLLTNLFEKSLHSPNSVCVAVFALRLTHAAPVQSGKRLKHLWTFLEQMLPCPRL